MANNNVQAQETESLNIREAFFLKYKKAIIIAVVAIIVIIAGVFGYVSQISGPREDKASTMLAKGQTYFANQMYEQALKGDGAGYVGFTKIADEYIRHVENIPIALRIEHDGVLVSLFHNTDELLNHSQLLSLGCLVLFLQVYVIVGQFCTQHIERCVQVGFLEHSITGQYECHHQQNYDV